MPIREHFCQNPTCRDRNRVVEHYFRMDDPPPICHCGELMKLQFSRFGIVFTGAITSRYNDKSLENSYADGHWAWDKANPEMGVDSKPVYIETFDQQREFCKRNGLVNPKDIGPVEVGSDGKSVSTRGLPGSWV